jgi:hypothetical protein
MIKLSVAAALLIGASAVSTDAKTKTVAKTEQKELADIDFLTAIAAIPPVDEAAASKTLAYWEGNVAEETKQCFGLFEKIIAQRRTITTNIDEYIKLVEQY